MTLSSTTNRVEYTGNAAVNTYSYTYRILDDDDLLVTVASNATPPVETTLAKTTDYTVTGVGDSGGGTIVLVDAAQSWLTAGKLSTGFALVIRRVRPLVQNTDIRNQGDFYPETHEDTFDHLVMIDQQQQNAIDRSVKLPESLTAGDFNVTLPTDIASISRALVTNTAGDGLMMGPSTDEISNAQTYANNAATSATGAAASATAAATSETNAANSATAAAGSQTAAATSETNAATSATNAAGSATTATTQATAAAGSATTATTQATNAATSATNAATSETNAAGSATAAAGSATTAGTQATNASNSATAAATSATNAATSATAAATTLASALWRDVVFLTSASSPRTIVQADNGKLFVCDTTAGAIVINLPQISGITLPFNIGAKLEAGTNTVTINRAGTDTIGSVTSRTLGTINAGMQLIADTDPTPDDWTAIDFGLAVGNLGVDRFNGDGSTTGFTLSSDPGSENNTFVMVSGVYQQKDTYSVSGTTLTFSTAPPTGTSNIEVVSGSLLSIGVPSDATVTASKFAPGATGYSSSVVSKTTTYTATFADDVILCSGSAFTVTLPAASAGTKRLVIKKTDSSFTNIITLARAGSDTIDGATSTTLNTLAETVVLVSDGVSSWNILSREYFKGSTAYTMSIIAETTAPTFGTRIINAASWRRVGDRIVIRYDHATSTAGTNGTGAYLYQPPSGIVFDLAKMGLSVGLTGAAYPNRGIVGPAAINTNGSNAVPALVFLTGTTYLSIAAHLTSAQPQLLVHSSSAFQYGNTSLELSFEATVPVVGWN